MRALAVALTFHVLGPALALAEEGISQGVFVANNVWMMLRIGGRSKASSRKGRVTLFVLA